MHAWRRGHARQMACLHVAGGVPGLPALRHDDAVHARAVEHDGGEGVPRAAEVGLAPAARRLHGAALEHQPAGAAGGATRVRGHPPGLRARRHVGHERAVLVDGLAEAEDEVDGAPDLAAAEVVPSLVVAQRVLEALELAAVEGALVAADQRRHRLVLLAQLVVRRPVRVLHTSRALIGRRWRGLRASIDTIR